KTTLLRVLSGMVPYDEQLLVIEDSAELHLELDRGDGRRWHPHVQHVCTVIPTASGERGVSMKDLVRAALRLRPNRIILGEARDASMSDVCMAASTGHDGSMVTLHCDDAAQGVRRAAEYVMMSSDFAGSSNSEELALRRVHQAFDLVVHLSEEAAGRRKVTGLVAVGRTPGSLRWIYAPDSGGRLARETRLIGDLPPNLRVKVEPHLSGNEVPGV
ncbi:MAG TPA: ATPase, T2SS/T4P/T4SS family, partial [Candidatus Dormibacteraeota bacterium]|nr:ATPase, T2SS/T4P/T4SS family [Candidatus Dormibacteraeota bacterium]